MLGQEKANVYSIFATHSGKKEPRAGLQRAGRVKPED